MGFEVVDVDVDVQEEEEEKVEVVEEEDEGGRGSTYGGCRISLQLLERKATAICEAVASAYATVEIDLPRTDAACGILAFASWFVFRLLPFPPPRIIKTKKSNPLTPANPTAFKTLLFSCAVKTSYVFLSAPPIVPGSGCRDPVPPCRAETAAVWVRLGGIVVWMFRFFWRWVVDGGGRWGGGFGRCEWVGAGSP